MAADVEGARRWASWAFNAGIPVGSGGSARRPDPRGGRSRRRALRSEVISGTQAQR